MATKIDPELVASMREAISQDVNRVILPLDDYVASGWYDPDRRRSWTEPEYRAARRVVIREFKAAWPYGKKEGKRR